MPYNVVILDDHVRSGVATQREIQYWDKGASVYLARSVAEAKKLVIARYPIGFVVVDLLLEQEFEQGIDFVNFLLNPSQDRDAAGDAVLHERIAAIPIMILSAHPTIINRAKQLRSPRVVTIERTNDFSATQATLKHFIDQARVRFG